MHRTGEVSMADKDTFSNYDCLTEESTDDRSKC